MEKLQRASITKYSTAEITEKIYFAPRETTSNFFIYMKNIFIVLPKPGPRQWRGTALTR